MTLQVFLKPVEEFFLEQSKVLGQTDRRKDKWTRGLDVWWDCEAFALGRQQCFDSSLGKVRVFPLKLQCAAWYDCHVVGVCFGWGKDQASAFVKL